jgi:hypothetical protein
VLLTRRVQGVVALVLAVPVGRQEATALDRVQRGADTKWKRHYWFNVRGVGYEHNGNVVRQFAGKNEKGDDGRAGLRQRYEEALLTGRCRIKKHLSKAPRSSLLSRKLAKQRHAQPERWGPG